MGLGVGLGLGAGLGFEECDGHLKPGAEISTPTWLGF